MQSGAQLPPWRWPRAAYVHVPFCAHRCGYCDFAVSAGADHLIEPYVQALCAELTCLGSPQPVDTIFLGGGTPTYLSARSLERLLSALNTWLPLCSGGEFTIEATPESVSVETVDVLAHYGVNRVSLGVQSFQQANLARLDRIHGPEHIVPAMERIRRRIDAISLDLIFGVPGQTVTGWELDLNTAVAMQLEHISTYGLTFEKGTAMWKDRQRGLLTPVAEADELSMYETAMTLLEDAGFEQYEISNYCRAGRQCRHNEIYWANEAYFGFGVGAARYVLGRRELNCRNTADYIKRVLGGASPTFQCEELSPVETARETIAIQLRRSAGVEPRQFRLQTGFDLHALLGPSAESLQKQNLIVIDDIGIRLTRQGRCVADSIVVQLAFGR